MKVIVSAGGRFHAHRLAQQLEKHHALEQLFTFDYTRADNAQLPAQKVTIIKLCKILNNLFMRLRLARIINRSKFHRFNDQLFDRSVSAQLISKPSDLFIGWANYATQSFIAAKRAGAITVLESGSCHIDYQAELLATEYKKWGLTYPAVPAATRDRMRREYLQADYIMTLSQFARHSFITQGIPATKVLTVPCGIDLAQFTTPRHPTEKFTVLFVGLVSLRKGVQYLLQAWHEAGLSQAVSQLIIIGSLQKDFLAIRHLLPRDSNVIFAGGMSRQQLTKHYAQAHCFVMPSIEDGFGMVLGEAMAMGLPVIASTHSGAPDIITTSVDGFLYSPYDVTALAKQLAWCYTNPTQANTMGVHGQQTIQKYTWAAYGQRVYDQYKALLGHD